MAHRALQERVCEANREISRIGLAILTWGNASEIDRDRGVFAIKPSGVAYESLTADMMPVISLETGAKLHGDLKPSSDTASHWALYRAWPHIGGIVHTHSPYATAFAQARKPIECLGTTHADTFSGAVPCTRSLTPSEVDSDYELNTGRVIVEHFAQGDIDPVAVPGVLVAAHAPFTWGSDAEAAVVHAEILEEVARIATITLALDPAAPRLEDFLLDKHHARKHGASAYYGQDKS
jgi:L-ribulose-5-phosphate 4-epimerase